MRVVLILLSLIVVITAVFWVNSLRRENNRLESRVERMETRAVGSETRNKQLERQIQAERSRLNQLQATLNEVMRMGAAPPTASVDTHLLSLAKRAQEVKAQLAALNGQAQDVKTAAQGQRLQTSASAADGKLDVHARIQSIDNRLLFLQAQLNEVARMPQNPENDLIARQIESERQALLVQRSALGNQIGTIATAQEGAQVAVTRGERLDLNEIAGERAALEAQLQDLNEEMAFWKDPKNRQPAGVQSARVQQLQDQIRAQETRLTDLSRVNNSN